VKFSIVTPTLRQLPWLKRCVRSVADQGVELEHLVQDGGSGPELAAWVHDHSSARVIEEVDTGIYDALNRGFARATGEIGAWLNSDEQYLPGTLARVREFFAAHPKVDVVAGDYLIVDEQGALRSFHKATPLRPAMILTDHLYDYSCALFFRCRLVEQLPFRTDFRAAGDGEWVARVLHGGARAAVLSDYLSVFTITDANVTRRADLDEEARKLRAITPRWAQLARPMLREWRHLEKWRAGGYLRAPISYEIFAGEDEETRTRFVVPRPSWRHPWAKTTID
jgi:glycosyltransferase involved in cell wall biosynthesis